MCRLRFPTPAAERLAEVCPTCGTQTAIMADIDAPSEGPPLLFPRALLPIEALLDNVRSLFNVGSIFRSADGAGLRRLHLCGITPTPANLKLAKTALGAEQTVDWRYQPNGVEVVEGLQAQGFAIWALEEHPRAESLFTVAPTQQPLLLVVGSEVTGVDPAILQRCDKIVAIPMQGVKRSLNVATAFGVAAVILGERWTAESSSNP